MAAVKVVKGGERHANNLFSCSHCELVGLVAGRGVGVRPHCVAICQDALNGASVKGTHDGGLGPSFSQFAEDVETPKMWCCCSRRDPLCTPRNLVPFTRSTVALLMVRGACWVCALLKSTANLSPLFHVQRQIVVTAPRGRLARLTPVICLISVAEETHRGRVVRRLNEEVGPLSDCAVMGKQS